MTRSRWLAVRRTLTAMAVLFALGGCGEDLVEPRTSEPHFSGTILSVEPREDGLLVEIDEYVWFIFPDQGSKVFEVHSSVLFREREGGWERVGPDAFRPGLRVEGWLNGAARERVDVTAAVLMDQR